MSEVICDRCERKYDAEVYSRCPTCNSVMKRPKWEKAKKWITKNFAAVATLKYGTQDELLPAFTNFYFDLVEDELKRNKIIFKTPEQLEDSLNKLNHILKFIGWKSKVEYLEKIKETTGKISETDKEVANLIKQYPSTLLSVLKSFNPEAISEESNLNLINDVIQNLNESIFKTEEHVKVSFKRLLKSISKQDERGMDDLTRLLETNSLLELTSVSRILMSRLNTLEMFESMAYNEEIYEVKGPNSIQSLLERNMWMLNEEWWLVQANQGMKKFIGEQIEKTDERKRPDFVCVSFEGKLIIVDIKRPSHNITKKDINQVEEYKLIAKEHKGEKFRNIECFVVGKRIPSKARALANERKNINLLTYNDLVENVRKKYIEYLEALKKARESEQNKEGIKK